MRDTQGISIDEIKQEIRMEAREKRRLALLEAFRHSDPTPHDYQCFPEADKSSTASALDKFLYIFGMRHARFVKKIPGLRTIAEGHYWRLAALFPHPAIQNEPVFDFIGANWDYSKFHDQLKHEGLKGRIKLLIYKLIGFSAWWQAQLNRAFLKEVGSLKQELDAQRNELHLKDDLIAGLSSRLADTREELDQSAIKLSGELNDLRTESRQRISVLHKELDEKDRTIHEILEKLSLHKSGAGDETP
jgi:hypothetical protein